jgi:hypothetical protein
MKDYRPKQYGQKRKKQYSMDIVECIKASDGLTVGKRYLKLTTDESGENVLTRNDNDEREIYEMACFKIVDTAVC